VNKEWQDMPNRPPRRFRRTDIAVIMRVTMIVSVIASNLDSEQKSWKAEGLKERKVKRSKRKKRRRQSF
jgi:hypothetical protein